MGLIQNVKNIVRSWTNTAVSVNIGVDVPKNLGDSMFSTALGAGVTPSTALGITAVYSCVKKIAETVAMLPVGVIDKKGSFGLVDFHGVTELLDVSPDGEVTANEFKETLIAYALLFGKGLAEIVRNGRGEPVELIFRQTDKTPLVIHEGKSFYKVSKDHFVLPRDMVVIPSLLRLSPITTNRETLGLLKSARDYASKFFEGGGVMNGLLSSEQNLQPEQINTLLETWEKQQGKQTRMIPFGFKYHRFGVEPDKAQNMEARSEGAREVCQIFNVPPAMIGLPGSSYGDFENQMKAFVTNCISPIVAKMESEYNLKLLNGFERREMTVRHDLDELSRGDMVSRSAYYNAMLNSGTMNRNEVRSKEKLGPIEGGEIYTLQVNQIALSEFEAYSKKISNEQYEK